MTDIFPNEAIQNSTTDAVTIIKVRGQNLQEELSISEPLVIGSKTGPGMFSLPELSRNHLRVEWKSPLPIVTLLVDDPDATIGGQKLQKNMPTPWPWNKELTLRSYTLELAIDNIDIILPYEVEIKPTDEPYPVPIRLVNKSDGPLKAKVVVNFENRQGHQANSPKELDINNRVTITSSPEIVVLPPNQERPVELQVSFNEQDKHIIVPDLYKVEIIAQNPDDQEQKLGNAQMNWRIKRVESCNVSVSPPSQKGFPGTNHATYTVKITNQGNQSQTYDLNVVDMDTTKLAYNWVGKDVTNRVTVNPKDQAQEIKLKITANRDAPEENWFRVSAQPVDSRDENQPPTLSNSAKLIKRSRPKFLGFLPLLLPILIAAVVIPLVIYLLSQIMSANANDTGAMVETMTPTATATPTAEGSATPTDTPLPTAVPLPNPTLPPTPTPVPTATPQPTPTPQPTATPPPTPTEIRVDQSATQAVINQEATDRARSIAETEQAREQEEQDRQQTREADDLRDRQATEESDSSATEEAETRDTSVAGTAEANTRTALVATETATAQIRDQARTETAAVATATAAGTVEARTAQVFEWTQTAVVRTEEAENATPTNTATLETAPATSVPGEADLQIISVEVRNDDDEVINNQNPAKPGANLHYMIKVRNGGAQPATFVSLVHTITDSTYNLNFVEAPGNADNCVAGNNRVTCTRNVLEQNTPYNVELIFKAPGRADVITSLTTVNASNVDPAEDDNVSEEIIVEVREPEPPEVAIDVAPDDGGPSNDIPLNGRARLTLEVSNPNDLVALENVTLETRFDNNGALIVANSPDVNGTCSGANFDPGVNQLSGSTSFVVSGFNLPIGDSCTIELDIKGVEVADNVQIQAINISAGNTNEVGESARRFVNIMPPHELRIVRGSGQAIEIGLRFPISLVTEVVDEFGRPIREVTVSYENDGGGNNPPIGLSEDGNVDVSDFDDLAGEIDGVETGSDNITTPIYAYAVRDPGSHRIIAFVEGYEEVVETAFFLENLPD